MTLDELRRYAKGARVGHKPGEQVRVHLDVEDLEWLIGEATYAAAIRVLRKPMAHQTPIPVVIDPDPTVLQPGFVEIAFDGDAWERHGEVMDKLSASIEYK